MGAGRGRGGSAGNKFRMTLALPVGAVMNCADNSGAKNLYVRRLLFPSTIVEIAIDLVPNNLQIIAVTRTGARLNRLPAASAGGALDLSICSRIKKQETDRLVSFSCTRQFFVNFHFSTFPSSSHVCAMALSNHVSRQSLISTTNPILRSLPVLTNTRPPKPPLAQNGGKCMSDGNANRHGYGYCQEG